MDWVAITPSSDMEDLILGYFVRSEYHLSADAGKKLQEIYNKLRDFASSKETRQTIIFRDLWETDLVPIMNNCIEDNRVLYKIIIKLLSELTTPIEDYIDVFTSSEESNLYQYELSQFLNKVKVCFLDFNLSKKIFSHTNKTLVTDASTSSLDKNSLEHFFRLVYNILSIADNSTVPPGRQNQIIWNFFSCKLDDLLLSAIDKDNDRNHLSFRIMEVIAAIYKDKSIHKLEGILWKWLDVSYSDESSEDNESNTSSPHRNHYMNEDSSDNNQEMGVEFKCHVTTASNDVWMTSKLRQEGLKKLKEDNADAMSYKSSDSCSKEPPNKKLCGLMKKTKNMEENSDPNVKAGSGRMMTPAPLPAEVSTGSSSNEDEKMNSKATPWLRRSPIMPHMSAAERREARIKKINKIIYQIKKKQRPKSIVDDEEISYLLTEFTISFIMRGYSNLIKNLRLKFMSNKPVAPSNSMKSRFLWLITFFLRFVSQLEVKLSVVESVISPELLSYLVYEGVRIFEELEMDSKANFSDLNQLKPKARHLHLVVSAIKQIVTTINALERHAEDLVAREKIQKIIVSLSEMSSFRQFHLLLIRKFRPSMQTRRFIDDIILTNHELLVMFEKVRLSGKFMKEHLEQFATVEVMRQYGFSLETFHINSNSLNEAIFTMMHHVSGDLNAPEALFIPQILKTFSEVWEKDLIMGEVWSDLIEYVIQKFINTMDDDPVNAPPSFLSNLVDNDRITRPNGRLQLIPPQTNQRMDDLQWHYSQCKKQLDPVGSIIEMYKEADNVTMTRQSVLQALLSYGIITHAQYIGLAKVKSTLQKSYAPSDATRSLIAEVGSQGAESENEQETSKFADENMDFTSPSSIEKVYVDEIEGLKDILLSQGKDHLIHWIQRELINVILVKYHAQSDKSVQWNNGVFEPLAYYSLFLNESIPMVPWSIKEESGLQTDDFLLLLKKIGINLPMEIEKYFPRIPSEWPIDHLLKISQKLGPIRLSKTDFDMGNHSVFSGTNSSRT